MLETSSAKTAEAVTPFASPMLTSIERLVAQLASRIAGPQSQFSGRSLQFADRIFSRRLTNLGVGGVTPETLLAEREMEPQKWLLPGSWVPTAAELRGGMRSAPVASPVPVAPKETTAASVAQKSQAVLPVAPGPAAASTATSDRAAVAAAMDAVAGSAPAAGGSTDLAAVTAGSSALPTESVASAAGKAAPPAAVIPAVATRAETATPQAAVSSAAAGRVGVETAMPQVVPAWSQESERKPTSAASSAKKAAAKVASPVVASSGSAPTGPDATSPELTVEQGASSSEISAAPVSVAPAASGAAVAASQEAESGSTAGVAAAPETISSPLSAAVPPAGVVAPSISAKAVLPTGLPQPGSGRVATPAPVTTAAAVPQSAALAQQPAPAGMAEAGTPSLARPVGETRVRDWLRPLVPSASSSRTTGAGPASAFARSLGHLGWSDQRLGPKSPQRGIASAASLETPEETEGSVRAATAPALAMVEATDLTPRAAVRSQKAVRPLVAEAALPSPSLAEAPALPLISQVPAGAVALPADAKSVVESPAATPGVTAAKERKLDVREQTPAAASDRIGRSETAAALPAGRDFAAESGREAVASSSAGEPVSSARGDVAATPHGVATAGRAAAETTPAPGATEAERRAPVATLKTTEFVPSRRGEIAAMPPLTARAAAARSSTDPRALRSTLPAVPVARAESTHLTSLSPGLLASPVLRQPLDAGSAAPLIGLFAAGQVGLAGLPQTGGSQSAGRLPSRTPGALATHTEQLATSIGLHAAAGAAGVDNPFGGVQRWRSAPGLAGEVSRALDGEEPAGFLRWTQLNTARQLPFLPSPGSASAKAKRSAAAMLAPMAAASASRELPSAALETSRPAALAPEPPVALSSRPQLVGEPTPAMGAPLLSPEPSRDLGLGRPWRLAGGMATLAELFAAGVGMGTGSASDAARKAGVAPAGGLMPPWLAKAAARTHFGLLGGPTPPRPPRLRPELDLVDLGERQETPASTEPAAAAVAASTPVVPAAEQPPAATTPVLASAPVPDPASMAASAFVPPLANPVQPSFLPQAGGLAATAEAFARSHGIEGAERQAASGATTGRWLPVAGGIIFVSDENQRAATGSAGLAGASMPMSSVASGQSRMGATSPPAARAPFAGSQDPARGELELTRTGASSPERGVGWGRVGGLGLRTELFAAGLGTSGLQARPLSAAQEPTAWATAPGVASPLAQALRTSEPRAVPRWALGDQGLRFVSGPLAGSGSNPGAAATRKPATSAQAAMAPQRTRTESTETSNLPMLSERPWLHAGGTAILAELFSAGIGLGAGAVSGLAQQAGVAAGRGLLPGWLAQLFTAAETQSEGDDQSRRAFGAALPFVTPDVLRRIIARRTADSGRMPTTAAQAATTTAAMAAARSPETLLSIGASDQAAPLASVTRRGQSDPFTVGSAVSERAPGAFTPAASGLSALWHQAGGLGASAEAFARGRGIELTAGGPAASDDSEEAPAGRWLPVSGGMVFVPVDRPAAARGKRAGAATRPVSGQSSAVAPLAAQVATQAAAKAESSESPAVAGTARSLDWLKLGGLGLRSELFASGLGQPPGMGLAASGDPLGGWAGAYQHLTSFPQQAPDEAVPPRRFAWSGAGGLMYLAGASPSRVQRRTAAPVRRTMERSAEVPAQAGAVATAAGSGQLPGGVAALAERFSAGRGNEPATRESAIGGAGSSALPLAALHGHPGESRPVAPVGSPISGKSLPGRLSESMFTGFPRSATADSEAETAAWPRAALHSVERLTKLLSQLPAQWLPSARVTSALQAGGVTESPIWQRLSPNLSRLAATALRGEGSEDGAEDEASERHTHLTMVKGSSPSAAQKPQRPVEPAWKQQTPQTMVSAALQKVAGSGTPMAAAAKMLESMRGQSGSASRPDDRISLGDLTLIAISMGENRMAAISRSQTPSPVPHVESALRQDDSQLVQPETEHTMNQKVDALAKMCLKYVEKHEKMMKERGSFDA